MLTLDATCKEEGRTLSVTSELLDVLSPQAFFDETNESIWDPGDEITRRVEKFGHPVGKGL